MSKRVRWSSRLPWTNVYGLARSLLAVGPLLTLLLTHTDVLFHEATGRPAGPACDGLRSMAVFCIGDGSLSLEVLRWASVVLLLMVVSGWRPRVTAMPHAWIAYSLQVSPTLPDGGEQIGMIAAFILLPVALTDPRRWHWCEPPSVQGDDPVQQAALVTANVPYGVFRIQMAVLYFHAAVGKFMVAEWADGTAGYYWLLHPNFGAAEPMRLIVEPIAGSPVGVVAITWGTLLIELSLAAGIVASQRVRWVLLAVGVMFHGSIALVMGLWSFSLVMFGALVVYLVPRDEPLPLGSAARAVQVRARAWTVSRRVAASSEESSSPEGVN